MEAVLPWLKTGALAVFVIWSIKSTVGYHCSTKEAYFKEFADMALSPFGVSESTLAYVRDRLIYSGFPGGLKRLPVLAHVTMASGWALMLLIQFQPQVRKKLMWLHKFNGKCFVVSFLISTPFLMWLVWNVEIGPIGTMVELPLAPITCGFLLKGWREAHNKDIPAHRSSMIMASAGFFFFLGIRACLPVVQGLSLLLLPLGGSMRDIRELEGEAYMQYSFGIAAVMSLYLSYGVAFYIAYMPAAKKSEPAKKAS